MVFWCLEGKRISIHQLETKASESSNLDTSSQATDKWKKQEESLKNEEDVAESGRIFVRNLPYSCTEDELQKLFEKFGRFKLILLFYLAASCSSLCSSCSGPISEIIIPLDKLTRKIKGYGVVTFLIPEHAVKAYTELDGIVYQGRMLHLLPGKAKEVAEDGMFFIPLLFTKPTLLMVVRQLCLLLLSRYWKLLCGEEGIMEQSFQNELLGFRIGR